MTRATEETKSTNNNLQTQTRKNNWQKHEERRWQQDPEASDQRQVQEVKNAMDTILEKLN